MGSTRRFLAGVALGAAVSTIVLVAATALAGTGVGAVFNLGRVNRVNEPSTLQGNNDSRMLRVVNRGAGAALNLQVEPGSKPMTVNSSETVDNLSAGLLDGKDSTDFLASNGKAIDAFHADTATTANQATAAANANALDGLDSTAFARHCKRGSVKGFAHVFPSLISTTQWTRITNTYAYSCWGDGVYAKKIANGHYYMYFDGFPDNGHLLVGAVEGEGDFDAYLSYDSVGPSATGLDQYAVEIWTVDGDGGLQNSRFTVAVVGSLNDLGR